MFFIIIYLYSILCIYIDILLYVVLQFLRPCSRPSMPMDALVSVSTTDVAIEASFSIGLPHTLVCVTFDKFTIVISLFYGILKFLMFLCFYRLWDQAMSSNVHLGWTSHLHHSIMCRVKYQICCLNLKFVVFMLLNFTISNCTNSSILLICMHLGGNSSILLICDY
jgi:hypothetical protein